MSKMSTPFILTTVAATIMSTIVIAGAAEVYLCGPDTVSAASSTTPSGEAAPLVCSLSSKEQRDRREHLVALVTKVVSKTKELDDGYLLTFENGYGKEIVEYIELERACCPFFNFTLTYSANNAPVTLSITGPEGSKAFSSSLLKTVSEKSTTRTKQSADTCCVIQK